MKTWSDILKEESGKDYFADIQAALRWPHYPPSPDIFRALMLTPLDKAKVIILGQDPYVRQGQANGLAFSVPRGQPLSPSLVNIYTEIEESCKVRMPAHGDLEGWAKQGVLLLNSILTVTPNLPLSHHALGWQTFTDKIINELGKDSRPRVFMLWGNFARRKGDLIQSQHCKLEAAHPSPLSARRGFFGCGHFKKANEFLEKSGQVPIKWEDL